MTDIARAVNEYMTRERPASGKLWPSSAGGCMRKEMLRLHGHDKTHPHDNLTLWNFMRFGWYEQPINKAMEYQFIGGAGPMDVKTQVEVGNEFWHGFIDMVLDGTHIIEIKSRSPYGKVGDLPYDHHIPQVHLYVTLLAETLNIPTWDTTAELVYIDRWTDKAPTIRQYDVTPTTDDIDAIVLTVLEFEHWAQKKDDLPPLPRNEPEDHPWECMTGVYDRKTRTRVPTIRCEYFGHCWPDRVDGVGKLINPDHSLPF